MPLLKEKDRLHLMKEFAALREPIDLLFFTQELECQYCRETGLLAAEVAALSDKISLKVYDFVADQPVVEQYGIDKIPAMVVMRGGETPKDYGIRYYGIPSGYEFSTLITDIMMVSRGDSGLSAEAKAYLAALDQPLHLQVFVTPTCPYCAPAVHLAHQLAFESELVRADMVEAIEFPHLSNKYQVQGVPRTVINDTTYLEGSVPESMLLTKIKAALAV